MTISVHNVYTLYSSADEEDNNFLSLSSRPQDWGDPRWKYYFLKLEIEYKNTIYINHCHLWTTEDLNIYQLTSTFGGVMGLIEHPGKPPEICNRSHLQEDDFWCNEWGQMPPMYKLQEEDYFDYE